MQPEIILWVHVLTRNISDSLGLTEPNNDKADWYLQRQAKNWIGGKDFNYICELIDLNPNNVIQIYEEIKKRQKSFTQEENYQFIFSGISRIR
tara:strand:+ start:4041 stop:4319 length:279 start_codon:yes stop_codon:yes gene_type:complete